MKKLLVIVLALVLGLSLSACSNPTTQTSNQTLGDSGFPSTFTSATNKTVTIGTGSGLVLDFNGVRQYAAIVNDSANVVYLSLGKTAVSGQGIRLNPNGGSYEVTSTNQYLGQISGISSASSSLTVVEK